MPKARASTETPLCGPPKAGLRRALNTSTDASRRRAESRHYLRALLSIVSTLLALTLASNVSAQQWLADGVLTLGSGAEGADAGNGSVEWQRARARVTAGIDLMNDEEIEQSWGFRGIAELEKSALVGAEVRYTRWLGSSFGGYISATGMIAPKTLVGMGVGANLIIPLGKRFGIVIDGSFSALPLGTDRANDGVVLWALLGAGVRVRF